MYHAATLMNFGSMYLTQRRLVEAEGPLIEAFALVYKYRNGEDSQALVAAVTSRLGRLQRLRRARAWPSAIERLDRNS